MNLELHATAEEVMRAVEALQAFGEQKGLPAKVVFELALALEETASNIVNHALKRNSQETFQVRFEHTGSAVVLTLRDAGPAFDPTLVVPKTKTGEELPGGWGIALVRRYMDEIRYERSENQNVLYLTKDLLRPG